MILTPLIGITIGIDVEQFYNLIDFFLFNFNWLGQRVIYTTNNDVKPSAGFFQGNRYLTTIDLESASTFYNIGQLVFVMVILQRISLVTTLLYILFFEKEDSKTKKFINWVFQLFHFTIFIKIFLINFTFVVSCAFSEIAISNVGIEEGGFWGFALGLFLGYILLTLVIVGQ